MTDGRKGGRVVAVHNQARHLVLLVGHQRFVQEVAQRHIGQRKLGGDALLVGGGGHAGQHVARAQRRGPRQQRFQVGKAVGARTNDVAVRHGSCEEVGKASGAQVRHPAADMTQFITGLSASGKP